MHHHIISWCSWFIKGCLFLWIYLEFLLTTVMTVQKAQMGIPSRRGDLLEWVSEWVSESLLLRQLWSVAACPPAPSLCSQLCHYFLHIFSILTLSQKLFSCQTCWLAIKNQYHEMKIQKLSACRLDDWPSKQYPTRIFSWCLLEASLLVASLQGRSQVRGQMGWLLR